MTPNPFRTTPFPGGPGPWRFDGARLRPDAPRGAPASKPVADPVAAPAPESDAAEPTPRKKRAPVTDQE